MNEFHLKTGLRFEDQRIVQKEDTAARYGSGLLEVLATPALIAFMEGTSQECVQPQLPEGFGTVGTEVHIKHMKATPVGMQVRCRAELIQVDGLKLTFRVEAEDEQGPVGEGTHKRFIIDKERFLRKIYPEKDSEND